MNVGMYVHDINLNTKVVPLAMYTRKKILAKNEDSRISMEKHFTIA